MYSVFLTVRKPFNCFDFKLITTDNPVISHISIERNSTGRLELSSYLPTLSDLT